MIRQLSTPATKRARHVALLLAFILTACADAGAGIGPAVDPTASPRAPAATPASPDAPRTKAVGDDAPASGPDRSLAGGGDSSPGFPTLPSTLPSAPPVPSPTEVAAPPSPVASPTPSAAPVVEAFAMNLYREGDFVPQYTFEWCVGASVQMALNMVLPENDSSQPFQQTLWEMARDRSNSPFRGANPRGWTILLNDLGIGPYELVSIPEYGEALRVAAAALRATERPVGLVMWRGRHAWVMNGFQSIGDPQTGLDFEVTGINVLDPLYPYGSPVWGPSPAPNAMLSPTELSAQFVIRDSGRSNLGVPPGYLLILPTLPPPPPTRSGSFDATLQQRVH